VVAEALGANGGVVLESKSVVLVLLGRDSVQRNAIVKEDCSGRHSLFVSTEDQSWIVHELKLLGAHWLSKCCLVQPWDHLTWH
jgi:hypothetical protein